MNKSKTKGKTWEREVVLFLSELYKESFIRVPNSGAYVGGQNEIRKANLSEEQIKLMRGDIIPPEHYPNFLAECKNYAQFPFHLLGHGSGEGFGHNHRIKLLDKWIEQVENDSKEDDAWLLFIKITRKGQYVVYDTTYLDPTKYGMRYRRYWFCEMEHFFRLYKDDIEMRWKKDYGREAEEN